MQMNRLEKTLAPLFWSLLSVVFGILLIIYSNRLIDWMMIFAGAGLLILGIMPIIKALLSKHPMPLIALISVVSGVLLLVLHSLLTTILFVFLGGLLLLIGIQQVDHLLTLKRAGFLFSRYNYLFPIFAIISGVITIFNPFALPETLISFVGWCMTIHGIISLFSVLVTMFRKQGNEEINVSSQD